MGWNQPIVGVTLLGIVIGEPWCAVDRRKVVHAVTYEALAASRDRNRVTADAACGARAKVITIPVEVPADLLAKMGWPDVEGEGGLDGTRGLVPWPVRVAALAKPFTRCAACWESTGRRRPRWPHDEARAW